MFMKWRLRSRIYTTPFAPISRGFDPFLFLVSLIIMQTAGPHKRSGEDKVETIPLAAITSGGPRESVAVSDPIDIIPESEGDDDNFPDGGLRAWLVVLGGFLLLFSNFGIINSWGTFQSYYEKNLLKDVPASNIAWIGSIQYSFAFLPSVVTGRLFDLGHDRSLMALGSVLMAVATVLTAQCKEYWQFLLCQGFGIGIASGIMYGPSKAAICHWFKKRLGLALGVMSSGASVGGTLFPIIFRNLIQVTSFQWTMRIIGFTLIFTLGITNLTIARRLPPVNVSGGLFDFGAFKHPAFALYTASSFTAFLGLYTLLTYIVASASVRGVDVSLATYLLAIANASSMLGRLSSGYLSDKLGTINMMTPFTFIAGVLTLVWPYLYGKAAYIMIAIAYGSSSGAFISLLTAPIAAFGDTGDIGRRTGLYQSVLALGAIAGPPVSGAIADSTGDYKGVGIFAGISILASVVVMWASRCLALGRFWGTF